MYNEKNVHKMKKQLVKARKPITSCNASNPNQTARTTFPERKQRVHTLTDLTEPLTIAFTFFTFGFQALFARL